MGLWVPTSRKTTYGTDVSTIEPVNGDITGPAVTEPTDAPPEGGYGWVVVFALGWMNGFTWGVAASYGVFLSYYLANDYFPGATALDYAFIGGLEFGCCMLISPACTILTREFGRPVVMTAGVFLMAGGYIAASFAQEIWQLYLSQGVLVGLGMGSIFIPAIAVLPQWFLKRRSLAQGLASSGSGFGGLAFSLGTSAMVEQLSLAWALRIVSHCEH
jgi:MFS family permease